MCCLFMNMIIQTWWIWLNAEIQARVEVVGITGSGFYIGSTMGSIHKKNAGHSEEIPLCSYTE